MGFRQNAPSAVRTAGMASADTLCREGWKMSEEDLLVDCWACGVSSKCERHHIEPQEFGGKDNPENIVPLCTVCHDILDRYRWQRLEIWSWFSKEVAREPGPRWARLMLLEFMRLISWLIHKGYIGHAATREQQ